MPDEPATITTPANPTACPCASCSTTGGYTRKTPQGWAIAPSRFNGTRYGYSGMLCSKCREREKYRRDVAVDKQAIRKANRERTARLRAATKEAREQAGETAGLIAREGFTGDYLPTPKQIAEAAQAERESWDPTGHQKVLAEMEAKDEARRRSHAQRAEIERAEIVRKRNRLNRVAIGVLRVASL